MTTILLFVIALLTLALVVSVVVVLRRIAHEQRLLAEHQKSEATLISS